MREQLVLHASKKAAKILMIKMGSLRKEKWMLECDMTLSMIMVIQLGTVRSESIEHAASQ